MILQAKQADQSPYPISPQRVPKLKPTLTLLTTSHLCRSREKRQTQPQLLMTSPQTTPMAARPVQDPRKRNKEYKIMQEVELKDKIKIPIRKEQIKWYNPTFMIKKANEKWRKVLDSKALNNQIADIHFKMHDSNQMNQTIRLEVWSTSLDLSSAFHYLIVQTESQQYLAFEFQNNYYTCRAMPLETKHSPIHFATAVEPIMQQIRMKTDIRIINYVDDILCLATTTFPLTQPNFGGAMIKN
ncbi:MAG: hypothetical protein EZS28_051718, partial [Streblomastix strix]